MIPKIIHRIWLGARMPERFQEWGETWKKHHPSWEHRLWSESDARHLVNQHVYDRAKQIRPLEYRQLQADVLRYELLNAWGGVYVDTDMECRRPIDELLEGVEAFVGWEITGRWANNAIMGAAPDHPFVRALVAQLEFNALHGRGRVTRLTGPLYMTPMLCAFPEVKIYPQGHFYPYLWSELERAGEDFPQSYAVHHWSHWRQVKGVPLP